MVAENPYTNTTVTTNGLHSALIGSTSSDRASSPGLNFGSGVAGRDGVVNHNPTAATAASADVVRTVTGSPKPINRSCMANVVATDPASPKLISASDAVGQSTRSPCSRRLSLLSSAQPSVWLNCLIQVEDATPSTNAATWNPTGPDTTANSA
ncbi:hypothetical protein GCM10023321_81020 [Pseudonocardia eucalypti]|uniref:Uncharacterized protein n=1 Tax=Pseudonocardia eucalypti TaxID=648755 RepID=A0ABP9RDQ8_9PSEU